MIVRSCLTFQNELMIFERFLLASRQLLWIALVSTIIWVSAVVSYLSFLSLLLLIGRSNITECTYDSTFFCIAISSGRYRHNRGSATGISLTWQNVTVKLYGWVFSEVLVKTLTLVNPGLLQEACDQIPPWIPGHRGIDDSGCIQIGWYKVLFLIANGSV